MVNVEACISADTIEEARRNARAAFEGGATTIELCRQMRFDGLTPSKECIEAARQEFKRPGLMVMIRPREGDFVYSNTERLEMHREIEIAAAAGADGVVFGILSNKGELDKESMFRLVSLSKSHNLSVTLHRAFDALLEPLECLDRLNKMGVDRILTSGVKWGKSATALDGVVALIETIRRAADNIEIVVAGGINPAIASKLLIELQPYKGNLSVHAYSGVQEEGKTTARAVRALVESVASL